MRLARTPPPSIDVPVMNMPQAAPMTDNPIHNPIPLCESQSNRLEPVAQFQAYMNPQEYGDVSVKNFPTEKCQMSQS